MSCITAATFPCLPTTFVGWSSLAYFLLPLNIAIYDLEHLYMFNCNCLKYHTPFSNSFQTGIYTYILCILSICHAIGSFSCHGCGGTAANYMCYIDLVALYCIYAMLAMFSWTRLYCQYKINRYYKVQHVSNDNKKNAKLIYTILFSSKYHWTSTIIALFIALLFGLIAILFFGEFAQLLISGIVYCLSYVSFFICEFFIRKILMTNPLDNPTDNNTKNRGLRISSTGSNTIHTQTQYLSIGFFEINTENKRCVFALIFIIIAACGYLIDILDIDKTCENIGHAIYHIFSGIAVTFWYWSLVAEQWTFLKPPSLELEVDREDIDDDIDEQHDHDHDHDHADNIIIDNTVNTMNTQQTLSPNSANSSGTNESIITSNSAGISDTSLRHHILNGTYSTGHDINDTVLNMDGIQMITQSHHQSGASNDSSSNYYKTRSGRKRSFLD